ncbi:MAG: pyruvoyl-dependent arginine decarboxylase [Candidatus Margulisiibacteriota bacterium]
MNFVPKELFLTKGVGVHREKLVSFELALRDAGVAEYNLVRVSSIFPPHCKIVSKEEGLKKLSYGQVVFCVLSDSSVQEENRLISASVGVALPQDSSKHGYLSEHHSYGETEQESSDYAEDMAAEMLATTLGIPIDTNLKWDERKEIWKMQDQIVSTMAVTQSATGKKGLWTTVVAGAVLIL